MESFWLSISLIFISYFFGFVSAVQITRFNVPKFVNRRDEVTLECKFRMSEAHETLHSVKWYRIDHKGQIQDFFTYQPRSNPTVKTYPRSGIRIDPRQSNVHHVTLKKVSLSSSGVYRCEVTSKLSPAGIDSEVREDRMVVLELPEEGPEIKGGLPNYQLNDRLELNCTSQRTFPPTLLKWYINNEPAEQYTKRYPHKRGSKNGLFQTKIGLNITVSKALYIYGKIHIKCVGVIEDSIRQGQTDDNGSSHEVLDIPLPEKWKRERPAAELVVNSSEAKLITLWWLPLLTLLWTTQNYL